MAQSISTKKFGTLDTSGRVPVYMAGAEGDPPPLNMGLSFDVGGKSYTFVPEDRITKGAVSGDRGALFLGFLDPTLLSSLKNNSEYVDIAGAEFGSFDIGKFISDQMGGSTKGYLAPKETIDPILSAGLTQYNPSFAGQVTGVGEVEGKPTYLLQSGYVLPNGQQVKTERKIIGYTYSGGGGLLAGLGREIINAPSNIAQAATNIAQPVEKTISQELAQVDKDLSLSQNAPLLAAIAVSVAMPGVGSAIGQQMIAAGLIPAATSAAVATAIGTGVANAALQVAQGKSAEDALKGAVVGGLVGFAGGQVGDYLVADPGAVKNFVSSTAANMISGKDPETAAKTALVQTGIQGTANAISQAQAEKYLENLPIPDYLDAGPAPTSADTIAAYPETNPNLVETTLPNLTPDQIDAALSNLTGGYTLGGTTEGISATLPNTMVTGTEPIDYTLNVLTGGEGLTTPTSPNLDIMGGGQGLTGNLTGGVVGEGGLTPTGNVTLGDPTSYINTGAPVTTNKTYTYDDGSTLTVDKDGTPIDYTEATDTLYEGPVETPSSPLTRSQIEGLIKLGLGIYGASRVSDVVRDAISSGSDAETPQSGFPFTPSDISGWARPEYTKTWQAPIDINSLFTTDNLLGGTQWAGLQGNQFANTPQVSMSDFISSIQNGKV